MFLSLICLLLLVWPNHQVAFKFVIADALPKVTYSTLMDWFILSNMAFLFATAVICTAGNLYLRATDSTKPIAWWLFLASGCMCAFINGTWLLKVVTVGRRHADSFEEMAVKDGKNWYHCRFASPFFMPPYSTSDGKMPGTTDV